MNQSKRKKYESPSIISYSSDDILRELGPARACSPFWGAPPPDTPGFTPGFPTYPDRPEKKKEWGKF